MMKNRIMTAAALACSMVLACTAGAAESGYAYEDDNIKLAQYKGLTYSAVLQEVTEEEIDAEIDEVLHEYSETEQIKEWTAQEGDTANIDYVGKLDGEAFDGGTAEDYDLVLGSGTFIPGFEDGVIGMEVGETKDITLTFPEDYHSEDLAGKETVFTVTLNYIGGEEIIPELTDEWVKENLDCENIEAYRAQLREDLETEAQDLFDQEKQAQILQKLVESSEVANVDPAKVEEAVQGAVEYYTNYAQMWGMEYTDFVAAMGYDEESLLAEFTLTAENQEKQSILLNKIAELEKIEVAEDEFEDFLAEIADSYGMENVEALKTEIEEYYADQEDPYETFRTQLLQQKVTDLLVENAVYAEEEAVDEEEELEAVSEEAAEAGTAAAGESEAVTEDTTEAETGAEAETEEASAEAETEAAEAAAEAETEAAEAGTEAAEPQTEAAAQ